LLHRCYSGAETGLVAGGGVLVDHALSHRFVDQGDGVAEGRLRCFGVARLDGLAQLAQGCPELRGIGPVGLGAFGGLARALQRRKMICHCALDRFLQRVFRRITEEPILLGLRAGGQFRPGPRTTLVLPGAERAQSILPPAATYTIATSSGRGREALSRGSPASPLLACWGGQQHLYSWYPHLI